MSRPVVLAIRDPAIRCVVTSVAPTTVNSSASVLVTDDPKQQADAELRVAFVTCSLRGVIRAMPESHSRGILRPDDATRASLTAIGSGLRVYSTFEPKDLELDSREYAAVAAAAQAVSFEYAAAELGYSARQMYRDLRRVLDDAGVVGRFRWSLLAPIFPTASTSDCG